MIDESMKNIEKLQKSQIVGEKNEFISKLKQN